jgi:hypothetical protein
VRANRLQLGDVPQGRLLSDAAGDAQPRARDELRAVELGGGMQRLDALQQLRTLPRILLWRRRGPVDPDVEEDSAQARLRRGRSR